MNVVTVKWSRNVRKISEPLCTGENYQSEFTTAHDTNQAVQPQEIIRSLEFLF